MNHRVSPTETASSAPNSPASPIHLSSPVNSPTTNLANMTLTNDLSQNSTIMPNKNDFLDCKDNGINDDFLFDDFDSNKGNVNYLPVSYCKMIMNNFIIFLMIAFFFL